MNIKTALIIQIVHTHHHELKKASMLASDWAVGDPLSSPALRDMHSLTNDEMMQRQADKWKSSQQQAYVTD